MQKKKNEKAKKKLAPLHVFLRVFTLLLAVFTVVKVIAQQPVLKQYDNQIEEYNRLIAEENEKIEYYKNLKELYQTEEYKVLIAKERLGLLEENEKVYIAANGK